MNILVSNDNLGILDDLVWACGKGASEATVVQAKDGREAMNALDLHKFDLAVLDCQMPFYNGVEVAQEAIRRDVIDTILFYTASEEMVRKLWSHYQLDGSPKFIDDLTDLITEVKTVVQKISGSGSD